MWGLELLQSGMRKVVGYDQSVNTFWDPWIPRPRTFRPISTSPSDSVMVNELIGMEGSWDIHTLSQYFLRLDIDVILGIPLRSGLSVAVSSIESWSPIICSIVTPSVHETVLHSGHQHTRVSSRLAAPLA
ncbi:hypothetical protein F8388_020457 [Cannabis sativa]|uniref:Uncharacterized protein n=1 Tax=Cannabis sativa TaxID=3483 RepID=A0A7J6E0P9_CANSA|nr:hypothetical protein F8388_020457 [Cannabis sativa]KAF4400527.1 hypothetical protein G4B88_023320 [Cannabis sativa]